MFGLISKKKVLKEAVRIYKLEDTSDAHSEKDLYYRMGNANALGYLCSCIGLDLTSEVKRLKGAEDETTD